MLGKFADASIINSYGLQFTVACAPVNCLLIYMFTGIIEEIGIVKNAKDSKNGKELIIQTLAIYKDTRSGDSICVNGVCLTATKIAGSNLFFDCMVKTLETTSLKDIKTGDSVNMESSLKINDKISGHFVTGHIDGLAKIKKVTKKDGILFEILIPSDLKKFIVEKGAVCLDGVSLTVAEVTKEGFNIYLIPFTLEHTTLGLKQENDFLNIECDILAKYVQNNPPKSAISKITPSFLQEHGFI